MKSFRFVIAFFVTLLFVFCKKDSPTFQEKIERSWRVPYYQISDIQANGGGITNGLAFTIEGINKGSILFSEHREFGDTKDTAVGNYKLDENAHTILVKWTNVLYPYGMTKDATYDINFTGDTLVLKRADPLYKIILIKAVRD